MSNFVCYESWDEFLDTLEQANGEEFANKCARQIIKYGVKGELTTSDPIIIGMINSVCKPLIDKSQKRYNSCRNNGTAGGRPSKYSNDEIKQMHDHGISNQIIADTLGCSLRTVTRALFKDEDDEI